LDFWIHYIDLGRQSDHLKDLKSRSLGLVDVRAHRCALGGRECSENDQEHGDVHFVILSVLVVRVSTVEFTTGEVENSKDTVLDSDRDRKGKSVAEGCPSLSFGHSEVDTFEL